MNSDHDRTNLAASGREAKLYRLGGRVVAGVSLAFLLIGGVGGWAATAQLTGAIVAQGSVAVDQNLKSIQHRDGGIVSQISVREGDFVQQGQVLIRLEDAQTRAELAIIQTQIVELAAKRARLLAERDGLKVIDLDLDRLNVDEPEVFSVIRGENRLFSGNLAHRESQKQQLELSIVQIDEEIRGLKSQQTSKASELELVRVEYTKIKGLADKRLIEGSRAYSMERDLTRLLGEEGEIAASIARAGSRQSELRLQIIAIDEMARTEAQRELGLVETRLAELDERATATRDRLSRTDIRAPSAGIVNELNVYTIGGVITPAEILATIVPDDAKLTIEVRLVPHSIDQVTVDRPARLRFTAFNQRITPELHARVTHLSPATSRDGTTGETYYAALVEMEPGESDKLGNASLLPGMPVEVYITTDERSPLSYISRPITDQFNKAFRER